MLTPADVWTACKITANGSQTGLLAAAGISFGLHYFERDAQRMKCGQVVVLVLSKYTLSTRLAFPTILPFLHTLQTTQAYSGPWQVLVISMLLLLLNFTVPHHEWHPFYETVYW